MKLAQRIRQARRKAKLSQQALAEMVGVQRSAVSNWESANYTQPAIANLIAIATATNISMEWLATGRGSMGFDHEPDVLAIDAELVDSPYEVKLLKLFRNISIRSQILLMELAEELALQRRQRQNSREKRRPD